MKRILVSLTLALCLALPAGGEAGALADPRTMVFPPLAFEIPKAERVELSNGMAVYLLEDHELPLVHVTAYIGAGSIYEPPEKTGLAGLTGAVMRSGGTLDTPPAKLDEDLEFMASSIESSIGADVGSASLSTLTKNLDRTLRLFAQVLMRPAFSEERVALARNRTIEAIRRQNDDPKGVADRELTKAVYQGHPLGRYPTIASVGNITREDMIAFHRRYYLPNNIILALSGDFKRDELLKKLEAEFGGWEKGKVDFPAVGEPAREVKPAVLLARKDINQSVVRMGHLGIDKDNPDLYAVRVMDYILGGGFTSRLMTEVRSNQGLAYHVGSSFDVGRRFVGTFEAETETKSESTAKAISLMRGIIAGMAKEPVSDQELGQARDSIISAFIFGFTNAASVVTQRARLEYYGYRPGYLENYRDNIAKVTKDDVLQAARKYLHADGMVLVVVGDEKGFDRPLSTFGAVREIQLEKAKQESQHLR